MNSTYRNISLGILCMGMGLPAFAAEKPVPRSELPAAVRRTADEQSTGAVVKRYVKDNEDGQLEYEMEMTVNGHSKDVSIAPNGRLLEVEEEIAFDRLPSAVQLSLKNKVGTGTIAKVESISRKGRIVAYEAQVKANGQPAEIQVGPEGQALTRKE